MGSYLLIHRSTSSAIVKACRGPNLDYQHRFVLQDDFKPKGEACSSFARVGHELRDDGVVRIGWEESGEQLVIGTVGVLLRRYVRDHLKLAEDICRPRHEENIRNREEVKDCLSIT